MSRFISMALKDQNISIYGDGSQSRTFCYIEDNVDACYNNFMNAVNKINTKNEVINVGSDYELSILELAEKIIRITNSKSKIVFKAPLEEGDMQRRFPDITKMRKLLNRELLPIDDGIKKILDNPHFLK